MTLTTDIENWTGFKHITGFELTQCFEEHMNQYEEIDKHLLETIIGIIPGGDKFEIKTDTDKTYESR
ncbi:hypothetical protein ACFL1R_06575 [Candidatus Latescibacterota bacterium]